MILAIALLLSPLVFYLFIANEVRSKRDKMTTELIGESVKLSSQIAAWLKENVKDGYPVAVFNDPELISLFKKDQELYNRIVELDPKWKNITMPPREMHKHLVELARGQYKQTH